MNVKTEVLRFLESKNPIPGATEADKLKCYYLDSGIIDSMGIVEMIGEFEAKFGIQFGADDLQSEEFTWVGGLISMIERLRGGNVS